MVSSLQKGHWFLAPGQTLPLLMGELISMGYDCGLGTVSRPETAVDDGACGLGLTRHAHHHARFVLQLGGAY